MDDAIKNEGDGGRRRNDSEGISGDSIHHKHKLIDCVVIVAKY